MTDKPAPARAVKGTITISRELCKECGLCMHFCPKKMIGQSSRLNAAGYQAAEFKDNGECTGCAVCAIVCPEVAIEVYRD